MHVREKKLNSNLDWKEVKGTNITVNYNRTDLRIGMLKISYSLTAGSSDKTTFLLPTNIKANMDVPFFAMALTAGWQPIGAKIYCTTVVGSNAIQIRTNTTLSSNVLFANIMLPREFFTIS